MGRRGGRRRLRAAQDGDRERVPRSVRAVVVALAVLWWANVTLAAGFVVLTVVAATTGELPGGLDVTTRVQYVLDPGLVGLDSPSEPRFAGPSEGVLVLASPTRVDLLLVAGASLVVLALAQVGLHQLRAMFRALADGAPFAVENIVRVRRLGLLVLAYEPLNALLTTAQWIRARETVATTGLELRATLEFDLTPVVAGLVLVAAAEAFRVGAALQRERDLTI